MENGKSDRKLVGILALFAIILLVIIANSIFSNTRRDSDNERWSREDSENAQWIKKEVEEKEVAKQHAVTKDGNTGAEPEVDIVMLDSIGTLSHLSQEIPYLVAQRRKNIETFVTRDNLPEELQQELDRSMAYYKQNGYLDVDDGYMEYMDAPFNEVRDFDLNDPSLMFEADDLEGTAFVNMEYIGIIPDRDLQGPDAPVPEISRVFKHEAGYLYLAEAGAEDSGAILQKEFVNKSVKGYPASQMTYCAPSERCVTVLSWLTANKRYELTLRGDIKVMGEEKFQSIADSLNLPPLPEVTTKK